MSVRGFFLACLLGLTGLAQASVNVQVDRRETSIDESIVATFEWSGELDRKPDFSPLEADFEILGSNQQSILQIVNGRAQSTQTFVLTLLPRRAGALVLPPISFGNERSEPLTIKVSQTSAGADKTAEIFIEVTVDSPEVYVQAQVLYTVRLFLGVQVSNATLSEPGIDGSDAVIEGLGDGSTFQGERNGKSYTVVERRYAIFPQASGNLTVQPLIFSGEARTRGFYSRFRRVRSDPVEIRVLPAPAAAGSGPWLPAARLELAEQWPEPPDGYRVGEPLTRGIRVIAEGLTAAQLPPLDAPELDGFRFYPDQPDLETRAGTTGVTGQRDEKYAVLPLKAGRFELPAVELAWWNTVTDREERARLPARVIEVLPAVDAAGAGAAPAPLATTDVANGPAPAATPAWGWIAATAALGAGWLLTVLAWWLGGRRETPQSDPKPVPAADARAARRKVVAACRGDDAEAASTALLAWGESVWPQRPPRSLGDLAARCAPDLSAAIDELSRARYGPMPASWQGAALADLVEKSRLPVRSGHNETGATRLAPLGL